MHHVDQQMYNKMRKARGKMNSPIEILHDVFVTEIGGFGTDATIADAARVSLNGNPDRSRDAGLINTLLKKRHGSPFEHTLLQFHVEAPIYAFREFMRHRIGFSYNEVSGRYVKLSPRFYIPSFTRPLVNMGTSMNPNFQEGTAQQYQAMSNALTYSYQVAWTEYEKLVELGIANEIARSVLPVGIMSQMVVTCNVRSLLNFLSLRVDDERNHFETKPQREIQMVALLMEDILARQFPLTYEAYINNGRVGP